MRRPRGLLLALCISMALPHAAFAAPGVASDRTKTAAEKVYREGADHYRAGRLAEALAAFRASYDLVPSPNSHLMIARTLRDKGEILQAFAEYAKVKAEAEAAAQRDPKYEAAIQSSIAERAKLRERLTLVTVEVKSPPDDLRVVVGGAAIAKESWSKPFPVMSGGVVAIAVAAGRPEQRQELMALPGGELVIAFDFRAPQGPAASAIEPSASPSASSAGPGSSETNVAASSARTASATASDWGYASLAVSAAGFMTFAVFGAVNRSTYKDLQASCPGGHCPPDRAEDIDNGRRAQLVGNIGFGVGVAGGVAGVVLLAVFGGREKRMVDAPRSTRGVAVTDLSVGASGVRLGGEF